MKKAIVLTVLALSLILVLAPVLTACNEEIEGQKTVRLVVYNWEDYIDESEETSRLDAFTEYYEELTGDKLEIVYTTFDTNETMLAKVLNDDANSVDLICPSEYAIQKLMANGRLSNLTDLIKKYDGATFQRSGNTLSFDNLSVSTSANTEPSFAQAIKAEFTGISTGDGTGDMADYMVPYMMGTLGILYNVKYVTEEDLNAGWGLLWNKSESDTLENKILVKDSVRDTYVAAVMYMKQYGILPDGYDEMPIAKLINCTDQALLDAAENVLTAQRAHISGYEVDFGKDDMLNEIVYADLAWSGDALWAIEESYDEENLYMNPRTGEEDNYTLDYFVPTDENGLATGNIWFDGWVIPKTASNQLAALMFIDFMNMPENAVYNSIYIGYTSAVAKNKMMFSYVGEGGAFDLDEDGNYTVNEEGNGAYALNEDVYSALVDSEYAVALDDEENNPEGELDFSFFEDERRYPVETSQLGVMRDFGDRQTQAITMWENAKTGNDVPWVLIWCAVAIVGLGGLAVGAYFIKERLKLRPRKIAN